ncbi:Mpp10 protein [Pleurotus eryngii]|uniref:Mpp10 protein n=1 Tax=Pleurotus eryngii TaxID=5323 RepID=A0A9P6DAV5_PLEER|nr:Mpp10 protein [Pleurotus eryngii]
MAETTTKPQLPPVLQSLTNLLDEKTETLAIGNPDIRAAALDAAKFVFDLSIQSENAARPHIDELLSSLSPESAPQTRAQARANGKRKRSPSPPPKPKQTFAPTPLTALYVDGVDEEQIWTQLDLRMKNVCDLLELALEGGPGGGEGGEEDSDMDEGDPDERLQKILEALRNGEDVDLEALGLDGMDIDDEEDSEEDAEEDSDDDAEEEEGQEDENDEEELGEHITTLRDSSSSEDEDEEYEEEGSFRHKKPPAPKRRGARHLELDDDFFDLASFNAETQAAEAKRVSRGKLGDDEDEDSDDDMSVDLFAAVDDVENFDEEDMDNNVGEAYYKDFFEPPPRLPAKKDKRKNPPAPASSKKPGTVRFAEEVRVKKIKSKGKSLPVSSMYEDDNDDEDDDEYEDEDGMLADDFGELGMYEDEDGEGFPFGEEDRDDDDDDDESGEDEDEEQDVDSDDDDEGEEGEGRETIERLKDDLFADEEDEEENDLTTHEQRMAALKEQIASLEAENVGKKDWVLMGEATSKSRLQNSLLEEDLEFERTMKAVPVVTEDKILALEDRIKARILEGRFDDVVRLRPINDKPFLPSRLFELQDTKSSQSLAQIYENDYVVTQNGGSVDDRDGKLEKEHEELEKQWDGICSKLDALCNAHFVPKRPKTIISTVANVSTTILESALPTTKSASVMLAPEEVFTPTAGDLRSKSEMAPAEKRAARNKERKSRKKTRDLLDSGVDKYAKMKGVKKQKQAALEGIVKTGKGVTVVGKKNKDILGKKGSKKNKSVDVSA